MTEQIHRLVYHSRNLMHGSPAEIGAGVEAILATSRRNNEQADVTGALIFNRGIFAQVLEGPSTKIAETFERIQRDDRHGDVQVLAFEPVAGRGFPSWSMAFLGRSREGEQMFGHLGAASGFDEKRLEGERIFQVMRLIALEEEGKDSEA